MSEQNKSKCQNKIKVNVKTKQKKMSKQNKLTNITFRTKQCEKNVRAP